MSIQNRQRYDADALLSQMPGGILAWGNNSFFFATAVLLALAWFVRYPQTVQAGFNTPAAVQPDVLRADHDGRLVKIFKTEGRVKQGDTLGILEYLDESGRVVPRAIISPKEGWNALYLPIQTGEKVFAGQPLFVLNTENSAPTTVTVQLPVITIGSLQPGQKALLHFDAYPSETYGAVPATVQAISKTALDDQFAVRLELTEGLQTVRHISLDRSFGLVGRAEIAVGNPRLIEKLLPPLQVFLQRQQQETTSDKPQYTQKGE